MITYKTLNNTRTKIIENFKKDATKLNFIISVHTLDECVDIPVCDSVYITYNVKNSINIIQRISRSLRIYENKQKSGIFLWCEKYNDLFKINKIISDYDIQFLNKVFIKYNEKLSQPDADEMANFWINYFENKSEMILKKIDLLKYLFKK